MFYRFQDKLWAVGGYDGQHASQTVEIYDPDTKRWTEGPKLIKKRSVVVCSVLDGRLYAIGGCVLPFCLMRIAHLT